MNTLATFIQHSTGSPSQINQARKRNKIHSDWKRRSKILFGDDILLLYVEKTIKSKYIDYKDSTKKTLTTTKFK